MGCELVDGRDGWFDWERAAGRRAAPFCAQLRRAVGRSPGRGRTAMVLLDNLGIHALEGSLYCDNSWHSCVAKLCFCTTAYEPESNRIEWLWRSLRRAVTHIGGPFADTSQPRFDELLTSAA